MANGLSHVLGTIRRIVGDENGSGPCDGELLMRFVRHRDQAAFSDLMRRHGPMVMGTCRRLSHNQQDAEDAFQAVFLVLVRRAASLNPEGSLAGWLYSVACKTAIKSRSKIVKRQERETIMEQVDAGCTEEMSHWEDLKPVLDEEVDRLPEAYRATVVLCCLEGKATNEAARELGCPLGTVLSRLARGREMLRDRLERRGLAALSVAFTMSLAEQASAAVPQTVFASTLSTACELANGTAVVSGPAVLAQSVAGELAWAKYRRVAALVVACCLAVTALGYATTTMLEKRTDPPEPAVRLELARILGPYGAKHPGVVLRGNGGGLAISADSRLMAVGDGTHISLWDCKELKETNLWKAHADAVSSLAFSPNGSKIASAGKDGLVRLWDVAQARMCWELQVGKVGARGLSFVGPGRLLAVAGNTGILLVDVDEGKATTRIKTDPTTIVLRGLSDGRLLWTDGIHACRYDPATNDMTVVWKTDRNPVWRWQPAADFSADGRWMALSVETGAVVVDLQEGKVESTRPFGKGKTVQQLTLSADGNHVLCSFTREIALWPRDFSGPKKTGRRRSSQVHNTAFVHADYRLVLVNSNQLQVLQADEDRLVEVPLSTSKTTTNAALSPDGREVAVASGTQIDLRDAESGELLTPFGQHDEPVAMLAYDRTGQRLITATTESIRVWDRKTQGLLASYPNGECRFALSPDGTLIAFTDNGEIVVRSLETGKEKIRLKARMNWIWSLAISHDSGMLAAGMYNPFTNPSGGATLPGIEDDGEPCLVAAWDLATGREILRIAAEADAVFFHPDGKTLYGLFHMGDIHAWDVATGAKSAKASWPGAFEIFYTTAKPSPDGSLLAVGMAGELNIYSLRSGEKFTSSRGHRDMIRDLSFSQDGRRIATSGFDGRVLIWNVYQQP